MKYSRITYGISEKCIIYLYISRLLELIIRFYIYTLLHFYISILLHSRLLYFYILICLDFLQCLYVSTLCCGCSALPFYLPARCAVEERGTVLMVIDSSSLVQILVHCWTWFICAAAISQTCHKSTRRSSGDQ